MAKKILSPYLGYGSSADLTCYPCDNRKFIEDNGHTVIVMQSDELEPLRKVSDDCVNLSDDAALLLNARRLDNQDPKFVADLIRRRFVERMGSSSPFDGLSDSEIFSAIKSRGIQSMSELDAYSEYLSTQLGDSIADIARKRAKAIELAKDEDSKKAVTEVTE